MTVELKAYLTLCIFMLVVLSGLTLWHGQFEPSSGVLLAPFVLLVLLLRSVLKLAKRVESLERRLRDET